MKTKNTNILQRLRLAVLALCLIPGVSTALLITPDTTPSWTTDDNSNLTPAEVATLVDSSLDLEEYYKADVGSGDSGPFSASYDTTYLDTPTDPSGALIEWILGADFIVCPTCYLLVKDGNQNPAQYVFDISSWDGKEDIQLSGFWPEQGAISHISIYGNTSSSSSSSSGSGGGGGVPEPNVLALLGFGLLASVVAKRRSRAKK